MTRGARLAMGAVLGGLLALFIHPRSRPLLLVSFSSVGPSRAVATTQDLPANREVLEAPRNVDEAGLWMQSGAERIQFRSALSAQNRRDLIRVAELAAQQEPQNAFWKQMGAVFADTRTDASEARRRWIEASRATSWNDHQSRRLLRIVGELERESGAPFSWHFCRAYSLRSIAAPRAIEAFGRRLLSLSRTAEAPSLETRLATLRNGVLLRDGARSIIGSEAGVAMVEAAAFPDTAADRGSPRKLLLARLAFANALRDAGRELEADEVARAYLADDAFMALTGEGRASRDFQRLARLSLAAAVVPSALVLASASGWVILLVAYVMRRWPRSQVVLQLPLAPLLGVVAGLAAYATTGLATLAFAIALCFAFLAVGPNRARTRPPEYLGPFFRFTVVVLAGVFVLLLGGYLAARTTPVREVLPILDPPLEFFSAASAPLGLASLVLGMILLVGPSWGVVLRVRTTHVVVTALSEFGRFTAWGCIAAAVLLAPIALAADAQIADTLNKLLLNEPTFYLIR